MSKKICISGYYGFDNFGDETILEILVENLKKLIPESEINVFSSNPTKTANKLNVKSSQTFNLLSLIKELNCCDCLISGGGSLLQDTTSKKSLIYYLLVLFIALFLKKRIIIFAQGIGPINNKLLYKITMNILKHAKYITVRDNNSLKLLENNGIKSVLCSDPVWNIEKTNIPKTDKIGIQLRACSGLTDEFLSNLAFSVKKHFPDAKIILLSLQNKLDLEISEKFKNILLKTDPDSNAEVIINTSNNQIINEISALKALIAMRYHANLIAIKNEVKVLPIAYDIKVKTLAKDFNLDYLSLNMVQETENKISEFKNKQISYDKAKLGNLYFDFKEMIKYID